MSYFDDASLVMIPSGYKEDKVYSVKPIDGSGDLDFTRASSATRIGPTGLIEKTRSNFITYSQDFTNVNWVGFDVSRTDGQTDPNGGSTAALYTGLSNFSAITGSFSTASSNLYSASIYIKGTTSGVVSLRVDSGATAPQNNINYTTEWQRFTYTFTANNATSTLAIGGYTSFTLGEGIYVAFAQAELGLVATDYIPTTSTAVTVGSYDNVPRLNYTAGSTSSCPSLLLEPQRTNLIDNSEYFEAWTQLNSSGTTNATTSPENVSNAYLLTEDSSNNQHRLSLVRTVTSGVDYVFSVYAKPNGRSKIRVRLENSGVGSGAINVSFDIQNGISLSANGTIENVGNGWYRCIATGTSTSTGKLAILNLLDDDYNFTYTGDGSSGAYFYGAQLEEGTYATSYIPTFGATVTRVAETCSKTGITSLIGQTEGTLFAKFDQNLIGQSATRRIIALSDGSTSNRIVVYISSSNGIEFYVRNSGGDLFLGSAVSPIGNTKGLHKISAAYKNNDYAVYLDGTLIISGSGTTGTIPSCTRLDLGSQLGANNLFEPMVQVLLFKTRLSNTQLAELTS